MSSLVSFEILSKTFHVLEVKVRIVHPDENYINDEPNYALQIVIDQFRAIENGHIYNSEWQHYPFSQEEGEQFLNDVLRKELGGLRELCDGEEVEVDEQTYTDVEDMEERTYQGREVLSLGVEEGGRYFVHLNPEYDAFCLKAEEYIESVKVLEHTHYPHWNNRIETWLDNDKDWWSLPEELSAAHANDPIPSYTLRITFKQPHILAHMAPGSRWESAAYDFEGYYAENYQPGYERHATLLLDAADIDERPDAQVLQAWWQALSEPWRYVLQVNLYLQRLRLFIDLTQNVMGRMIPAYFNNHYPDVVFKEPSEGDLEAMLGMRALFAGGADLDTLEPVGMLKGLCLLDMEENAFKDLTPLSGLKHLAYMNFYGCDEIEGFAPVQELRELKYVYSDIKTQADIGVLASLTALRELHFFSLCSEAIDLSGLAKLADLKAIQGYAGEISEGSQAALKALHEKGVSIDLELGENSEPFEFD